MPVTMAPAESSVEVPGWSVPWIGHVSPHHIREYLPTFVTEFTLLLSQVLAFKLAAHYLGKTGFAEFALVRRLVALIAPIPLLGIGVALPRFIGQCNGNKDNAAVSKYYVASVTSVGFACLVCVFLMGILKVQFAFLFFGNRRYSHCVLPLALMIIGLSLHTVACGYFRGNLKMHCANLLQFFNLALAPLLVFVFAHRSLDEILVLTGTIWTITSCLAIAATIQTPLSGSSGEARDLLCYGIQRIPGDFTLVALFTLPVTVVAHVQGTNEAGYLSFAISVLSMICAVFQPVGLVLLPKATYMLAEGAHRELRSHVSQLVKISVFTSLVLALFVGVFANQLIQIYLGHGFDQLAGLVRIVVIGTVPYSAYLVLRNVIDAFHKNGVTALILLFGLALFGLVVICSAYAEISSSLVVTAFLGSLGIVAVLSAFEYRRILALS